MLQDANMSELLQMKLLFNQDSNIYIILFTLLISNLIKYIYYPDKFLNIKDTCYKIKLFFFKHNKIIIEGKRAFKNGAFSMNNENMFSDTFNALWHKVNLNLDTYNDIYSIKECHARSGMYNEYGHLNPIKTNETIFIVNQSNSFKLEKHIYCNVSFKYEQIESEKNKNNTKIENIKITIYSYVLSIKELTSYINNITQIYKKTLNNSREDKIFIYTYQGNAENYDKYEGSITCGTWQECIFNTTTSFDNKFFENKDFLLNKLDFFYSQKEWYDYQGIPYSLGIGLSGPPGTGKTSIIKSIANKLKRHIVIIPLNKISSENEFYNVFYESRYNKSNEENSIGFDKKIIVFEDIDCMSDIVYDRKDNDLIKEKQNITDDKDKKDVQLISTVIKACKDDDYDGFKNYNKQSEDKLTLSFILNIIDGIRETPGRVLIITSNYYDKLDKALIRPGRIDISLEMKLATIDIIEEMFNHFYNYDGNHKILFNDILKASKYNKRQLQDYKITQAEIVKCYNESPCVFLDNIMNHMI